MVAVHAARILLVDDDNSVRRVIRTVLEQAGFIVLEAGSGAEALSIFFAPHDEIDLLLSVVLMPGMSGPELVTRLRTAQYSMPVLFISAYCGTLDTEMHGF